MKKSISNFWLLSLVIIFIFIFSAYLIVTLNYAKAFKVKNEVLNIVEKKKGISRTNVNRSVTAKIGGGNSKVPSSALGVINIYLHASGYKVKGTCDTTDGGVWYGVDELVNNAEDPVVNVEEVSPGKEYYYCFSKWRNICTPETTCDESSSAMPYFYNFILFYRLELPVLGDLFTFRVKGTSDEIFYDVADTGIDCRCA